MYNDYIEELVESANPEYLRLRRSREAAELLADTLIRNRSEIERHLRPDALRGIGFAIVIAAPFWGFMGVMIWFAAKG